MALQLENWRDASWVMSIAALVALFAFGAAALILCRLSAAPAETLCAPTTVSKLQDIGLRFVAAMNSKMIDMLRADPKGVEPERIDAQAVAWRSHFAVMFERLSLISD